MNRKLIESILKECPYGFISYGNLHNNDDEGIDIIMKSLESYLPEKPMRKLDNYICPKCRTTLNRGCCCSNNDCRQKIDWEV